MLHIYIKILIVMAVLILDKSFVIYNSMKKNAMKDNYISDFCYSIIWPVLSYVSKNAKQHLYSLVIYMLSTLSLCEKCYISSS